MLIYYVDGNSQPTIINILASIIIFSCMMFNMYAAIQNGIKKTTCFIVSHAHAHLEISLKKSTMAPRSNIVMDTATIVAAPSCPYGPPGGILTLSGINDICYVVLHEECTDRCTNGGSYLHKLISVQINCWIVL